LPVPGDLAAGVPVPQRGPEQLGEDTSPAANAYRDRLREQFTERFNEHAAVQAELDAPIALREKLYAAFDIHCLFRQEANQATVWATITDTTPAIINALLTDPRTDTAAPVPYADLQAAAITAENAHIPGSARIPPPAGAGPG
jgi:hypothetical protein